MVDETDKWENRIKRMRKDKYYIELTERIVIDYPFASQYRTRRYRIEHLDANNYFTYAASKARWVRVMSTISV